MEAVKDASHPYEVERRTPHVVRPDFRVTELQISPTQTVPWHYHSNVQDTFYVLEGQLTLFLRDPEQEVRIGPGDTYSVRPRRQHFVTNSGDASATFLVLQGIGEYDYVQPGENIRSSSVLDWLRDTRKRNNALSALLLALVTSGGTTLLSFYFHGSWWSAAGTGLLAALLMLLGICSAYDKKVERAIGAMFTKYFMFCFWVFVTAAPSSAFLWFSRTLIEKFSLRVQLLFLFLWTAPLAAALSRIATARNRKKLFRWLERVGALAPFVYCFNILLISVILFGTVSYLLAVNGKLEFKNVGGQILSGSDLSVDKLLDFFMWHFFDAIPLLKINDTLRWKNQLTYENGFVGSMVLFFKIAVIVPTIAAFGGYWKYRQSKNEEKKRQGSDC